MGDKFNESDTLRKKEENRARNSVHMQKGVLFIDPDACFIDAEVEIAENVQIGPWVTIKGKTKIGAGTVIEQNVYLEDAEIGENCRICQSSRIIRSSIGAGTDILLSVSIDSRIGENTSVGPYAYLRPNSNIGANVKIGDFVEIKNSAIGDGTKVSHLTYVGDADLGNDINLGCGVVFVTYDGSEKHRSVVGDSAFIGCNVNIIAPVEVGEGAYVAAGTTVTKDVPGGSLSIGRTREAILRGWKDRRKEK
ncbi:MAG: UDP-N-acetylglucosamine diphosphorylase [Clostridiales Family XIII bacterium]|nr:UDP-N-acetylglucosamine diphosphorylase [Clostridiales Family XIII bacterium]